MWRSQVAHLPWAQGITGSNPVTPTEWRDKMAIVCAVAGSPGTAEEEIEMEQIIEATQIAQLKAQLKAHQALEAEQLEKLMAENAPLQAALQKAAKAARHDDEALGAVQVATDWAWWKVWKIKKMWTAWKEWTSARDAADETRLEAQLEARLAAEEEARRNHCYIPWITRGTKEK